MRTRIKAPSPALVIALIALFVSLGGAGYAAVTVTGKNVKNGSLTGSDVRNNSLTGRDVKRSSLGGTDIKDSTLGTKDIKNGSLVGADLKADSVSGNQILESGLGKVSSASTADQAARAASAVSVDNMKTLGFKRVTSSASDAVLATARQNATEVPLFSDGPFDVYGKCFTETAGPSTVAEVYIRTDEDGSIAESLNLFLDGTPNYLDTGTAETARTVSTATAGADQSEASDGYHNGFFAVAPSGTGITGDLLAAAKNGTPTSGNGAYGAGNACIFSGHAIG